MSQASDLISRRTALGGIAASFLGARSKSVRSEPASDEIHRAVQRGVHWLLEQQARDGGWHSKTYGIMKGGAGNTALILSALSQVPSTTLRAARERGFKFLTSHGDTDQLVAPSGKAADFPVPATALALLALKKTPTLVSATTTQKLCQGLRRAQRRSENGWPEDHPDFGGWGFLIVSKTESEFASPTNVSATAQALSALQSQKFLTKAMRRDALKFLASCQVESNDDADGGFVFTSRPKDTLNKRGWRKTPAGKIQAHPYPTATCDGISALSACGVAKEDPRISRAVAWLCRDSEMVDPEKDSEKFRKGLAFYESESWARIHRLVSHPQLTKVHQRHVQTLIKTQHPDGSWANKDLSMREDDPLIATAFAISTLALNSM